jgi:hypothetical protein
MIIKRLPKSRHSASPVLRSVLLILTVLVSAEPAVADNLTGPYARQVQQMYVAYYGRPGDPDGVGYWAGRLAAVGGNWIGDLVNAFGRSAEYTSRFGDLADETLIDNLYKQLFNRAAEGGGRGFYVDLLGGTNRSGLNPSRRRSTLAVIALDIANGAVNGDAQTLANKVTVATSFTAKVAVAAHPYKASDIPLAVRLMSTVDSRTRSVALATTYVDAFVAGVGSGIFLVDRDIQPGTYANIHNGNCYWARLSGFGGTSQDLIANDFIPDPGPVLVSIAATDVGFESSR